MSDTPHDDSIPGQLKTVNQHRDRLAQTLLGTVANVLGTKTTDYGPVSAILDIAAAATGYNSAGIPAGEAFTCYRVWSKLLRYMNLRALGGPPHHESIKDSLQDLVGEAARLYAEHLSNEGPATSANTPAPARDRKGQKVDGTLSPDAVKTIMERVRRDLEAMGTDDLRQ